MTLNVQFGLRIRELRKLREHTQEHLAERSGLSVDGIRRIERGAFSPSLDTIDRLCRGLEITIPTLFDGLKSKQSRSVAEIADYLAHRQPAEVELAWRLLRALFEK